MIMGSPPNQQTQYLPVARHSPSIACIADEIIAFHCRPFGSINYGFALPRHSPYTHNFSVAMLELQQEGFLERMTEKWFRSRSVCGAETQAAQEAAEEGGDQLHFSDMAGVFITLAVGVAVGMVVLLLELIYASCKDKRSRDAQVDVFCFTD